MDVSPILLNGDPLPWVLEVKHLGNVLQADKSMKVDCVAKRASFLARGTLSYKSSIMWPPRLLWIFSISMAQASMAAVSGTCTPRMLKGFTSLGMLL